MRPGGPWYGHFSPQLPCLFAPAGPGRGRWAGRGRSVVVRPPAGRPGLADVLQVAADRLHLQVDGCVAGENQGDRARPRVAGGQVAIGSAPVCTPVTNADIVCRL